MKKYYTPSTARWSWSPAASTSTTRSRTSRSGSATMPEADPGAAGPGRAVRRSSRVGSTSRSTSSGPWSTSRGPCRASNTPEGEAVQFGLAELLLRHRRQGPEVRVRDPGRAPVSRRRGAGPGVRPLDRAQEHGQARRGPRLRQEERQAGPPRLRHDPVAAAAEPQEPAQGELHRGHRAVDRADQDHRGRGPVRQGHEVLVGQRVHHQRDEEDRRLRRRSRARRGQEGARLQQGQDHRHPQHQEGRAGRHPRRTSRSRPSRTPTRRSPRSIRPRPSRRSGSPPS